MISNDTKGKTDLERVSKGEYYEDCSRDWYEVSIIICTYNPDIQLLLYAIRSALLQRDTKFQIVISDDGSDDFDSESIIRYFNDNDFHDFTICRLENNAGTVKNLKNGLRYSKGQFVKDLGQDDYIYGYNTIREWIDFVQNNETPISFSNVICYRFEKETIVPVRMKSTPQVISNYYKGKWEYNYLMFDDLCVGVGMLAEKEVLERYLSYVEDKVIYAEDHVYRIMAYNHEKMVFYNKPTALYEVGDGISTSESSIWNERIKKDLNEADRIILQLPQKDTFLSEQFKMKVKIRNENNKWKKRLEMASIPGYLKFKLQAFLNPRYTDIEINNEYIDDLLRVEQ